MARFCPLFSSSSGNSMLFGGSQGNFLVDIGVSAKRTELALKEMGVDPASIETIFLTHEHIDHVRGLRVFGNRYRPKIRATQGTLAALAAQNLLPEQCDVDVIPADGTEVAGMLVLPFATSHDCQESCGYHINTYDGRRAAVATDLGYNSNEVRRNIADTDLLVIESNHDVRMLQNGSYPYLLKRRILSNVGHLSNESCAVELPELVKNGTARIFLAHLSQENNIPALALETSRAQLTLAGCRCNVDYELSVAPRNGPEKMVIF